MEQVFSAAKNAIEDITLITGSEPYDQDKLEKYHRRRSKKQPNSLNAAQPEAGNSSPSAWMRSFILDQMFSIGFKSGDEAGHARRGNPFPVRTKRLLSLPCEGGNVVLHNQAV